MALTRFCSILIHFYISATAVTWQVGQSEPYTVTGNKKVPVYFFAAKC